MRPSPRRFWLHSRAVDAAAARHPPFPLVSSRDLMVAADAVYVSAASIWEIAIKSSLGKIEGDPVELAAAIAASGFHELPVTAQHGALVARLPMHHSDPFDRLLVAQAISEPLKLLTSDARLSPYSELVTLV